MKRESISEAVKSGKILCADGAWGTSLMEKGLKIGECSAYWCLTRPDDVMDVAKSYIAAGADMIQTNSFSGSRINLKRFGLEDKAWDINEAAARISRMAAGEKAWVMASVGPVGKFDDTKHIDAEELYEAFKEQAMALEKGGADAICIETMMSINEATTAIKAAKENTDLEIICTFAFVPDGKIGFKTLAGELLVDACVAVMKAGAHIIGANCCSNIGDMVDITKIIHTTLCHTPIIIQANAGLPGTAAYPLSPEIMAEIVPQLINAGANIIGGCCGTTPAHIKAIKRAIDTN